MRGKGMLTVSGPRWSRRAGKDDVLPVADLPLVFLHKAAEGHLLPEVGDGVLEPESAPIRSLSVASAPCGWTCPP